MVLGVLLAVVAHWVPVLLGEQEPCTCWGATMHPP